MSSTVVQKQVGQTMVQLPQVRQRDATSFQRSAANVSRISTCRSTAGMVRPMRPAASVTRSCAAARVVSSAGRRGSSASTDSPSALPARARKRCPSSSSTSVSTRSYPGPAAGPASMDAQKHVAPGSVHSTATRKARSRRPR